MRINSIIILLLLVFGSCTKDPNHSVRFENQFSMKLYNVKIGKASYGTVVPKTITDYKPIDEGNFSISGTTDTIVVLTGSGTVSGKGTHKWTAKLNDFGSLEFKED